MTQTSTSRWLLLFPFFSVVLYLMSSICMRQLAGAQVDPVLIVGIREGFSGLVGMVFFAWLFLKGKTPLPSWKHLGVFFVVALGLQFIGNIFQQQGLEVIGMGLTTASFWSGQILWTPVLGFFLLREKLTPRLALSLVCALAALVFLANGAEVQESAPAVESSRFLAAQYVFWTLLAGILAASSNCVVRWINKSGVSPFFAVMFLPGVGGVGLLGMDLFQNGTASWEAISTAHLQIALMAGVTNLLAFICLTLALRYLDAVRVCLIMILQLALAPTVGCLVFKEPMNAVLLTGMLLVVAGVLASASEPQKD